jgi:hypothetical protein
MSDSTGKGHDELKIPLPSWTIVNDKKLAILKDVSLGLVKDFVPLFRSSELACEFIENSNGLLNGYFPLELAAISDVRKLLAKMLAVGGEHVGIDCTFYKGQINGKWKHISVVLAAIDAASN